jgi:AraC-like DNA-binding protein
MSTRKRRRIPRVALLVETTRTYTRELLAGVRRYIATYGPWSTFLELRALDSSPPGWLQKWDGDGILTRTCTQEMASLIAASGLPAVELRATNLSGGRPFVGMDNANIGRAVAEVLDRLMQGESSRHSEILFPPKGIIVRVSSDALVINDSLVAQAARLIRENAMSGIKVDDFCRKLSASRSILDLRMKAALKRSPKEEITRIRFREVERLLRETEITIEAIAEQTGFADGRHLQAA